VEVLLLCYADFFLHSRRRTGMMDSATFNRYVSILLGVLLVLFGLSIAIGGDYYSSRFGMMIQFGGLHVPFGILTAAVGLGFLIASIRIRKSG